jgi:NAD(P)H-dependent FMN reductase
LWIDALSIRKRAATFGGKKGAVVGVAAGRAGNLRGIDQLVGILHYLNMTVLPHLQPYSQINKLLDENGTITDANTLEVLQKHVERIAAM